MLFRVQVIKFALCKFSVHHTVLNQILEKHFLTSSAKRKCGSNKLEANHGLEANYGLEANLGETPLRHYTSTSKNSQSRVLSVKISLKILEAFSVFLSEELRQKMSMISKIKNLFKIGVNHKNCYCRYFL